MENERLLIGRSWSQNLGSETQLIQTEKLCVVPVFPLQSLSACGEEGLTTIIGWWKIAPTSAFRRQMVWKRIEIGGS